MRYIYPGFTICQIKAYAPYLHYVIWCLKLARYVKIFGTNAVEMVVDCGLGGFESG